LSRKAAVRKGGPKIRQGIGGQIARERKGGFRSEAEAEVFGIGVRRAGQIRNAPGIQSITSLREPVIEQHCQTLMTALQSIK
jgi:hypothetical protein